MGTGEKQPLGLGKIGLSQYLERRLAPLRSAISPSAQLLMSKIAVNSKKGFNPHTDSVIHRLIVITFEAALPPAISAICDVITSVTQTGNVHATFNMLTPRREATREMAASGSDHVSAPVSGSGDGARRINVVVGGRHQSWFPQNQKKSQIHVETETITHHHDAEGLSANCNRNVPQLSPHSEDPREGLKPKEEETSSVSTTWGLDGKVYEMDDLAYGRDKYEARRRNGGSEEPAPWQ
ncbi:NAD binding domain of 6-phosphogluconate dehydrogenase domain-containing protein [Rhizoctonia solani AG-1 IA]|uniref:NAD binding domain of 6-phosphogluconate dehydrogenase domain-containing protein n=1 Tax=Thanatephorus cucumeris (strain AG1-IA) TaxID=983506 RepID=L8X9R1_THACA|nr:NAD binding domain of 6-phosphogluconate dehydrogenase domain-containing protein [Rhizoctonia solani AG-1 IA]